MEVSSVFLRFMSAISLGIADSAIEQFGGAWAHGTPQAVKTGKLDLSRAPDQKGLLAASR
jgi:hypothetical protein